MAVKTLPLLSFNEAEALLRKHASLETEARPSGLLWKHSTAFVPSNDPIEDAHCHQIIQRDPDDPATPGDYLFFAVMDGHGGFDTSKLLSKTLIKAVALELSSLITPSPSPPSGLFASLKRSSTPSPLDADPIEVSSAIQRAFQNLDQEILKTPIRILTDSMDEESRKKNIFPDISQNPLSLQTMLPAISGRLPSSHNVLLSLG